MWGGSSTSSPTVLRGAQIKLTRRLSMAWPPDSLVYFHTAMTAHRLMRKDMLAWDGPLHAGAPSLPACVLTRARRRRRHVTEASSSRFSLGHLIFGASLAMLCRVASRWTSAIDLS